MRQILRVNLLGAVVVCLTLSAPVSADLLGNLKNQAAESLGGSRAAGTSGLSGLGSSLGLPSIGGGATSNVAGVLQYCVENKYQKMANVDNVKDQLLGKLGMESPAAQQKDEGYQQGLAGMLSGSDGSTFDMNRLKGDLKDKACDYVLDNATSLL